MRDHSLPPVISSYRVEASETSHPRAWGASKHFGLLSDERAAQGTRNQYCTLTVKSLILDFCSLSAITTHAASCGLQMIGWVPGRPNRPRGAPKHLGRRRERETSPLRVKSSVFNFGDLACYNLQRRLLLGSGWRD